MNGDIYIYLILVFSCCFVRADEGLEGAVQLVLCKAHGLDLLQSLECADELLCEEDLLCGVSFW